MRCITSFLVIVLLLSCANQKEAVPEPNAGGASGDPSTTVDSLAAVTEVAISGSEGNYTFSVTVKSPDKGCDQYADWWEVVGKDGELKHRRVLRHSHVDEQPFTRSGSPVPIPADEFVYIRAHMNTTGYGSAVFAGTVADGFEPDTLSQEFAIELASQEPLPEDCAF